MEQSTYREQQLKRLDEFIQDIRIAMLTTSDRHGALHSRPLATQEVRLEGHLWCFVGKDSPLMQELQEHPQVNMSFADPERGRYVSVSGTAALVHDPGEMSGHWDVQFRTWLSHGFEEPSLVLVQIQVDNAEYWDVLPGMTTRLLNVAGTTLAGQVLATAEHNKLVVDERQTGP